MTEQINLFGEECPIDDIPSLKSGRKRRLTMQEFYGLNTNHKCKECKHLIKLQYSKAYYKCALWHISGCAATDIRVNKTACAKFEMRSDDVVSYMGR